MEFLYLLEKIRFPFLDKIMLAVTYLGDEIAFLVVALFLFWCVDKRKGYFVLSVGFFGTIISQFMKIWFRIPRPWVKDDNFTILEEAREGAGGYSFPSGHSQSSVGTFGSIAVTTKSKLLRILSIAVCLLVPFSRMYIGVHTPLDVLVGFGLAVVLILVLRPLVFGKDGKYLPGVLLTMTVLAAAYVAFIYLYRFPEEVFVPDPNTKVTPWFSAAKNAYTMIGALTGFLVVYFVDRKWLNFPEKAVWWAQIIKFVVGLGLVLMVKEGMRAPLEALCGALLQALPERFAAMELSVLVARAMRYFLIVIMAGVIWPISFRWFAKLGKKE